LNDPRLDDYRFLRDRDLSGARRNEGLFVGETLPILAQMLAIPGVTRSILASQRMAERAAQVIAQSVSPDIPLLIAPMRSSSKLRDLMSTAARSPSGFVPHSIAERHSILHFNLPICWSLSMALSIWTMWAQFFVALLPLELAESYSPKIRMTRSIEKPYVCRWDMR
jgi:hypothetical protein